MPKNQPLPNPEPNPINIDDLLGLLGRAVNAASGGANAVVRRAQGKPIYGGKTHEETGNIINDTIGNLFDTVVNSGNDIVRGAHDADWSRGRSYSGKRNGRNADQLGIYPSGGNWHHPEEEAGLPGIMNDVMRRMHSGANTIDIQIMQPIKRTIAENEKIKEDRKKEKADLAINTQRKSVERLPNGLIMTTFEQRKTPAYPSGGNWFDPESESGLSGLITNVKRSINSRNSNTKKRGSVQKANWGEVAANAGKMIGRLGEMGGRLKGFGERIGRGFADINPMVGEEMFALTHQGLAGTPEEYLRRNSRPPIDVTSQAGMNDYLQRMGRRFDTEIEVPPIKRNRFTDPEMEFQGLDPELEPTHTNAFYQGYRVNKPKSPTPRGYRGINRITSDLKNKRINDFNDYMAMARNATKGFTLKRAINKRAKKEPTCDCGEPISQCKCSGHNHKSMQKGGLCKCGSGMMKSMCKCGGMGKSMNKSMYKSMSGKMDADMAITPQKISTNRSIKSSNKYFN